jgi:hypothetical protein
VTERDQTCAVQAIQAGKTLYIAGPIAIDTKTNQVILNGSLKIKHVVHFITLVLCLRQTA